MCLIVSEAYYTYLMEDLHMLLFLQLIQFIVTLVQNNRVLSLKRKR